LKEQVVLYRGADGRVAALQDRCSHRFAPLHMGKVINGDRIQCPYHGLEFDGSGACVLNPHGAKNIPSRAHIRSYPVTEKHKAIWIWMGDQSADLAKVPDFSVLDNVPEMHATKQREGDDVIVGRHASGVTAPGLFAIFMPSGPERVDKFTSMRWMPPSNLRLVTGICPPGAVPESGTGYHAIHMLTPETDRTTHYFFTAVRFNVLTPDDAVNAQIQEKIATTRRFAFEEQDAPVIEAQQLIIDAASTAVDPVILAIDVGPVRYKQILQRMIQAESMQ
jgi:vanillate O-demethylase monooxygenase subunit